MKLKIYNNKTVLRQFKVKVIENFFKISLLDLKETVSLNHFLTPGAARKAKRKLDEPVLTKGTMIDIQICNNIEIEV